jgi:hypothetical protein
MSAIKAINFNLPLTVIMVEDPKIGGYTAFFKQFPNIVAEGDSDKSAMNNLMNAVHDVFTYQGENENLDEIDGSINVIERPINFISNACI